MLDMHPFIVRQMSNVATKKSNYIAQDVDSAAMNLIIRLLPEFRKSETGPHALE